MNWKRDIRPKAKREIRGLPKAVLKRTIAKIIGLTENPFPDGAVKLKMIEGYRIRVGDWRILYEVDRQKHKIIVFAVRHRSKAYK